MGPTLIVRIKTGLTTLHYTVGDDNVGFAKKLLELKADVNCKNHNNQTPLMCAV